MEPVTNYTFNVQVFYADGTWNYSVIQEFEGENEVTLETLGYGTADTDAEAFECAAQIIRDYFGV